MTTLIDGTTPLPENGDTGWGSTLNAAINEIDGRFTYSAPNYGLAADVTTSNLTTVGTLTGLTVGGNLTVSGNVTINGTTTTINSTTITTDDIVLTLGGDTAPTADDNKDRGIEYRWHSGTSAKLGFFGYDDSTGKFTFIPDATNTAQVFSGTLGTIDVGAVHINGSQIAASNLSNGTTGSGAVVLGTSPTISAPEIDNPRLGYTTTVTASATTTLTATSSYRQFFTGVESQTVTLPVASTMAVGQGFEIHNNSTQNLTVQSSGGNTVILLEGGRTVFVICVLASGTTAASWDADYTGASTATGTGSMVFATSPTLTTPNIGVATATSVNKVTITAPATSATLTIANGKTLTASNTLTFTGTDSSSVAFGTGGTVAYQSGQFTLSTSSSTTDAVIAWDTTNKKIKVGDGSTSLDFAPSSRPINAPTLSANNYTLVAADRDKLVEVNNGATANTLTVPLNSSVPYPIGTQIVIVQTGSGQTTLTPAVGVTINGTPGLKISAQWGVATLIKRGTDTWLAYGNLAV